jgi:phage baseplate assembly protein W
MAYRVEPSNTGIDNPFISGSILTAVGVSLPFNGNIAFNSVYSTIEQVRSNLIDYVLTNKGERPLNPRYGSNLRKYLFSNITDQSIPENMGINDLKSMLTTNIQLQFPQIKVIDLTIAPSPDTNIVNISLTYSFLGILQPTLRITT